MREDEPDEADFETREEWEAAREAAAIGGERGPALGGEEFDAPVDEAMLPVYEAGGGEQEGFELAEFDLVRNASHDDGEAFPERDAFTPETESDRSPAEYAEVDEVQPEDQ